MAAEVAQSPSQAPTGTGGAQTGGGGGGSAAAAAAVHSSGPKSPFHFANSPSSSSSRGLPPSQQTSPQHYQSQSHSQPHYRPPSPSDEASTPSSSFFLHHPPQRLSPSSHLPSSAASERTVPRGLPPMPSPGESGAGGGIGGAGGGMGPSDPRLPISPGEGGGGAAAAGGGGVGSGGGGGGTATGPNNGSHDVLTGDPTMPRKRSKVSRACDECRRKKIRCDASSESGIDQCSSCKRVGSKCSFSRVPMKRGPSKGYIKELADRLNTLENSISTGDIHSFGLAAGDSEHSPGPSDSTSPSPAHLPLALAAPAGCGQRPSKKRSLSSSSEFQQQQQQQQSGVHLQPLSQASSAGAAAGAGGGGGGGRERLPSIDSFHPSNQHQHQQRSRLLQHESQRQLPHPQHSVGYAHARPPQPPPSQGSSNAADHYQHRYPSSISTDGTRQPYWAGLADRRASVSFPYDMDSQRPPANNPVVADVKTFEWDEESIDQYYSLIHPTFPLLPHSKPRLRQRLAAASITVREALLEALYAAVRSNPSSAPRAGAPPANPRRACELCVASQFESQDPRATVASALLYLQTMVLMALEADNHGPATGRGQSGPPRATWVGGAVGLAYSLKLHHNRVGERFAHGDPDSDEKLGRRAWWVLVVLDRWHAISTSSPLFIPDSNVVLLPEDQMLIGLSCILGHLAEAFTTADEIVSAASLNPYICRLLRGELERFRESVEVVWGSLSLLHVAYYHVKLLTLRHNSSSEPRQLLEPALRMATMLDHSSIPITPLNHHFAALALITLVDLADIDETRDEAWRGIQQLDEALKKRRGLATREDSVGWDRAIKDLINTRFESRYMNLPGSGGGNDTGGLRHLAELAIGDRSPAGGGYTSSLGHRGKGLDAGKLQKYGYLGSILL